MEDGGGCKPKGRDGAQTSSPHSSIELPHLSQSSRGTSGGGVLNTPRHGGVLHLSQRAACHIIRCSVCASTNTHSERCEDRRWRSFVPPVYPLVSPPCRREKYYRVCTSVAVRSSYHQQTRRAGTNTQDLSVNYKACGPLSRGREPCITQR